MMLNSAPTQERMWFIIKVPPYRPIPQIDLYGIDRANQNTETFTDDVKKQNPTLGDQFMKNQIHFAPLIICLLTLLTFNGTIRAKQTVKSQKQPNILFLFTDDQRFDTIHALGNPQIKTPHFDKLVQNGFTFNNTYCMGSWCGAVCLPSRTMVMTGRTLWRIPRRNEKVSAKFRATTLPAVLKRAGYVTYRTGKGGNTFKPANDEFDYNTSIDTRDPFSSKNHTERAMKFLRSHKGDVPFYIHMAFAKPHDPRVAPPEYMKMYDPNQILLPRNFLPQHPFDNGELRIRDEMLAPFPRSPEIMRQHIADYYACITYLDVQIGRILKTLEECGFAGNTIVVFSSDQGLAVGGQHGLMGKQNLYECNKPPLIFTGPGIPHGKSDALVYLHDLYPTFCELAGIVLPGFVEGESLWPIIKGKKAKIRNWIFGAYKDCQRMIRDRRWKLIKYNAEGVKNKQLFDLKNDPDEINNLAHQTKYAEHLDRLEKLLIEARRLAGDPDDFDRTSNGKKPQGQSGGT
ncbi:MAG: sulfatase-like hydrolase/transferase [Planctomycetota bacterium]|nr:MAG: sulfatase-like hydrolase/transferase [Planctomycetota bacterium]